VRSDSRRLSDQGLSLQISEWPRLPLRAKRLHHSLHVDNKRRALGTPVHVHIDVYGLSAAAGGLVCNSPWDACWPGSNLHAGDAHAWSVCSHSWTVCTCARAAKHLHAPSLRSLSSTSRSTAAWEWLCVRLTRCSARSWSQGPQQQQRRPSWKPQPSQEQEQRSRSSQPEP